MMLRNMMLREELKSLVGENMYQLKEQINDMPNHFPFNLANDLSDQNRYCDIRKLYDTINKLDPKHGAALILKYKYKFNYKRIEETLGYNPGCGSMIINRIIDKLKQDYDIYVYDKEYIDSIVSDVKIKKYEDEINNLKTEISKLNIIKDILTSPKDDQNTNIKTEDK